MEKSKASAHASAPSHTPPAAPGDAHAAPAAAAAPKHVPAAGLPLTPAEAKRVGGFASIAGWALGLITGAIVAGLATTQAASLFGLVGVPLVLVSYFLSTFAGGRITADYFHNRPVP